MRPKLTYANVMATIAVFIALGGTSYAAFKLPKNSVGAKQLKKNAVLTAKIKKEAVTAAKVKKGSLTGTQINASTLGTVPTAQVANSLIPPENWHEVGTPGEPGFQNDWHNVSSSTLDETAAFFKDHDGIVHLKGLVQAGTEAVIFQLPRGYRPRSGKMLHIPVYCKSGSCSAPGIAVARIGSGSAPETDGAVAAANTTIDLAGITFRAES
jgi:hypothetical protein